SLVEGGEGGSDRELLPQGRGPGAPSLRDRHRAALPALPGSGGPELPPSRAMVSVTSRAWVGAACVLALSSLACGRGGEGGMAALPPSSGWSEGILADRAAKDRDLRVDPDTPLRKEDVATFRGLEYWPPDPAYRFAGAIDVYDAPRRFTIVTTTGKERPCERYGQVAFELRGKRCVLQVYRLLDA